MLNIHVKSGLGGLSGQTERISLRGRGWVWLIALNLFWATLPSWAWSAGFDAKIIPTIVNSAMDSWYKVPVNSAPVFVTAGSIHKDQIFNLLVIFKGYTLDGNGSADIVYDVQTFDPNGKPTEDTAKNLVGYKGKVGNRRLLIMAVEFLKIEFTDSYIPGKYTLKVRGTDRVSGRTFDSVAYIELKPFELPDPFASSTEARDWMRDYHRTPRPDRAIDAVRWLLNTDEEWGREHPDVLTFFRVVYRENPFLLKYVAQSFDTLSPEDKYRFLLLSALAGDRSLEPVMSRKDVDPELRAFYRKAGSVSLPNVTGDITSPEQVDILWAEFSATGKFEPVRKIVGALALKEQAVSPDNGSEKSTGRPVEETRGKDSLDAAYRSVIWSLTANCRKIPLVMKYCTYIYTSEKLDESLKTRLGSVLSHSREEMGGKGRRGKTDI
jgi:hypothetical protein